MMSKSDLPKSFWGFALETASYILNNVPSKSVNAIPYEIWSGRRSNLTRIKAWGCPAYVKTVDATKLEPRSQKCIFIGFPKDSSGYLFYNPGEQKTIVSRHAVFLEEEYVSKENSGSDLDLREVQTEDVVVEQEQQIETVVKDTIEPRRSGRIHHEIDRWYGLIIEDDEIRILEDDEPTTYQEVLASVDKDKWLDAMNQEMESMYQNQVWNLVDPPEGIKTCRVQVGLQEED